MDKEQVMLNFLTKCQEEYHKGTPLISDEEFDTLANQYNFNKVGALVSDSIKKIHPFRMYSLQKVYEEDNFQFPKEKIIISPKLDGSAIALLYVDGMLVQALTRGDGFIGEDITSKMIASPMVHNQIPVLNTVQITGEVVADKSIENSRNYVSGALHLKDLSEFLTRKLAFIAYGVQPSMRSTYTEDMEFLRDRGFNTVTMSDWEHYPQDGKVLRLDDNSLFDRAGYTSKHPRGAWALKRRKDVAVIPTVLRAVHWQVGKGGRVTPVAEFDEIIIEDAKIVRATLHNPGFIEEWDLSIGDEILITRSGGIIPKVVGKT